jgi:hypothetical protein
MGGWLSPVRDRVELLARQSVFRGMSHIKGCCLDSHYVAAMLHPSATGGVEELADGVTCEAYRGLVRLRTGARIRCASVNRHANVAISSTLKLDGSPAESVSDLLLDAWTSLDASALEYTHAERHSAIELHASQLGLSQPAHLAFAARHDRCISLTCGPQNIPGAGPFVDIQLPTRELTFDVFVHESLFENQMPKLLIRDPAADRSLPKPARDIPPNSKFETASEFAPLDLERARLKAFPEYREMLDQIFTRLGWAASSFRSYRSSIRFPLYGSIVQAVFRRRLIGPAVVKQ